jgi:hypothetical protein
LHSLPGASHPRPSVRAPARPGPGPGPAARPGYFAYDTVECIVRYKHEGPEFLTHGVFCFLVFTSLTHIRQLHWFGCARARARRPAPAACASLPAA